MGTLLSFLVLLISLLICLAKGLSTTYAILVTLVAFILSSIAKGYSIKEVLGFGFKELPKVIPVARVLLFVGLLTGLWRSSGTIAYFLYGGLKVTPPSLFILLAFLLCAMLSYLLGSSFAVSSTAGVILMAIARSGGASLALTAGAVLSGVYFGDRGAPTSSSAALVASITDTDLKSNVKLMFRTSAIPYAVTLVLYAMLSLINPLSHVESGILESLQQLFTLSPWVLLPAILMLVLPLLKVRIWQAMGISAIAAALISVLLQGYSVTETLGFALLGFSSEAFPALSGGGAWSMFMGLVLIIAASMLSGILRQTKVLDRAKAAVEAMAEKTGLFPAMLVTSLASAMVFCNQTVSVMLPDELMKDAYKGKGCSDSERAMDIENSGILLAAIVPWSIACSVPLDILGADLSALPFAFSVYLIPLIYLVTKRLFFRGK